MADHKCCQLPMEAPEPVPEAEAIIPLGRSLPVGTVEMDLVIEFFLGVVQSERSPELQAAMLRLVFPTNLPALEEDRHPNVEFLRGMLLDMMSGRFQAWISSMSQE